MDDIATGKRYNSCDCEGHRCDLRTLFAIAVTSAKALTAVTWDAFTAVNRGCLRICPSPDSVPPRRKGMDKHENH